MSERIINAVEKFAGTLLPSMGLELVEVQFRQESHGWVLRIFIECEGSITVDHCADVSREVSDFLDVEDLIEQAYNLEVSSPGLERPLHSIADFEKFIGEKARVKLRESIDGQKVFIGNIQQIAGGVITMADENGDTVQFDFEQVRKARLSL